MQPPAVPTPSIAPIERVVFAVAFWLTGILFSIVYYLWVAAPLSQWITGLRVDLTGGAALFIYLLPIVTIAGALYQIVYWTAFGHVHRVAQALAFGLCLPIGAITLLATMLAPSTACETLIEWILFC